MNSIFESDLEKALETLRSGGVILNPTDTIWGLGCDATNSKAVEKVFAIKNRSEAKSLIVLIDNFSKLADYVENVPEITADLLGSISNPVTVIYSKARRLAENVIAQDGTIGIRIVRDEFCSELIRRFGKPIVSTSANISGFDPPAVFSQVSDQIKNSVDFIVTFGQEYFNRSRPSMIIRLHDDGSYDVIRG
jgi:L-threonylcarbamoyladenylate synthase